jgi:hypothetical protein
MIVLSTCKKTLDFTDLFITQELDSSIIKTWGPDFIKEYGIIDIELLEDFWRECVG